MYVVGDEMLDVWDIMSMAVIPLLIIWNFMKGE